MRILCKTRDGPCCPFSVVGYSTQIQHARDDRVGNRHPDLTIKQDTTSLPS